MKRVILIDNYDSFTYNLVHTIEEILGHSITVKKNDEIHLTFLEPFEYLILSPGPGLPSEAGLLKEIIEKYKSSKKIFGVCLGLQAIAECYGYNLQNLNRVYHGIKSTIYIESQSILYHKLENTFDAGRYHSWVMKENKNLDELIITARSDDGKVMSLEHKKDKVYAVQYHPESFMTKAGKQIITNFLESA